MYYNLDYIYHQIEKPLIPIMYEVMCNGVMVDKVAVVELMEEFKDEMEGYRQKYASINLNSGPQVGDLLYKVYSLPPKTTKSGAWQTDADQIERLKGKAEGEARQFLDDLLAYRKIRDETMKFGSMLVSHASPIDSRIRGSIMQCGTDTGRMSMHEPNLMNIPHRTEVGGRLRRCFIPADGYVMMEADLSQIELRVEGVLTQDPYFLTPYFEGRDLHRQTQEELSEYGLARVDAKTVNFGVIYEQEAAGLAETLKCSVSTAQSILDTFWSRIQPTALYIAKARARIQECGYAETWFGRRRYIKLDRDKAWLRKKQLREAVNMPTQGTAADIFKLLTPHWKQACDGVGARMILPIHDAWLVECPEGREQELAESMIHICRTFLPEFPIPLDCEAKVGYNWTDMKEVVQ